MLCPFLSGQRARASTTKDVIKTRNPFSDLDNNAVSPFVRVPVCPVCPAILLAISTIMLCPRLSSVCLPFVFAILSSRFCTRSCQWVAPGLHTTSHQLRDQLMGRGQNDQSQKKCQQDPMVCLCFWQKAFIKKHIPCPPESAYPHKHNKAED